jgi:hypothetical protein
MVLPGIPLSARRVGHGVRSMRHNDAGGITLRDDIADDCAISLRHFQTVLAQEFGDRNRIRHTAVRQDLLDRRRPDLEATLASK